MLGHMVGGKGLPGQTRMPESPGHKGRVQGVGSIATLDALTINSEATSHVRTQRCILNFNIPIPCRNNYPTCWTLKFVKFFLNLDR